MLRNVLKISATMLALYVTALHAQSATITATSTAQKDVAAAIASANNGDTVVIPAGDSTWTSTLSINKSINIVGQGTNATFLRNHGGIFTITFATDIPIRITGIYFDMTAFDRSSPNRSGLRLFGSCTSVRVDNCYFNCGERSVSIEGFPIYGVIDHCTFRNSNLAIYFAGDGTTPNGPSWNNALTAGSTDMMVVEDCTFLDDQPGSNSGFVDSELYGQDGGRACVRHCTIDYSNTGLPCIPVDAHGYNSGWGDSTRFYEFYNNTFKCQFTYNFVAVRGGMHLFHDNQFVVTGSSTPNVFWLQREHSDPTIPSGQLVKSSYFWNNTLSVGGSAPSTVGAAESGQTSNEPVLNVDVFNRAMQSGEPWYPYTPLVYPHPRVTADGGANPSSVRNLRVLASGS
jgi:hypothetical protein